MISCTEFIPAYSELFTYLEDKHGRAEVDNFWAYLFAPTGDGIPLINHVKKEGIAGCFSYWASTLNEEAADFTMMLNEKGGWFKISMHRCPSKGRLLQLKDEIGIVPYHDYCLHCDSYRSAVSKIGLDYIYDFDGVDKAACTILITDLKVFDGRVIVDEHTKIMDKKAGDNEYFHPDFHSSMNMGIHYLGANYGEDAVNEYLTRYTKNVYQRDIANIKANGLSAIEQKILDTYKKEKAEDAVSTSVENGTLTVDVHYCPAVKHLKGTGRVVSEWYRYTTETVMQVLANESGYRFKMEAYDAENGSARYSFSK